MVIKSSIYLPQLFDANVSTYNINLTPHKRELSKQPQPF